MTIQVLNSYEDSVKKHIDGRFYINYQEGIIVNMKDENRRVSHKIYEAWEYEREIEDLNRASQEGWQLEKGGCFYSVFRKDEQARYLYQIDYTPRIKDKERYLEMFREQGWEYINSTFNGWNYFKKPYSEDLPEDEKVIYTDKQSLYEMQNRYVVMLRIFVIFACIMVAFYLVMGVLRGEVGILVDAAAFFVMAAFMGLGLTNVSRVRKGKKKLFAIPLVVAYPIIILLIIVSFVFV